MNISQVIAQLRTAAPIFGGNVAGAAQYAKAVADQVWLPAPAAYVIPLDTGAGENELLNGLLQVITERVGVIVALDNSADRRGQTPVAGVDVIQAAIFKAILSWRPDSTADNPGAAQASNPQVDHEARGFAFDGGRLLDFDLKRLFYQWDFALEVTIDESDAWQPTGVPLTEIGLNIDFNGDGVPDVLAAAVTASLASDTDGTPINADTTGDFEIGVDNPAIPFNPQTGDPAGS